MYRVELPGPKVTKDIAADARIRVEMRREFFNEMVAHGAKVADWREAFTYGRAKATGSDAEPPADREGRREKEERRRTRRAHKH